MWSLPESARLPSPVEMEGKSPWWHLSIAWRPSGLALSLDVMDPAGPSRFDPDSPQLSDGLQLWIDTRGTREIHRATRFCHRFLIRAIPDPSSKSVGTLIEQATIHRAVADAPKTDLSLVKARAGRAKGGWWLDLDLPASSLHGFDPETNPRLGFLYCLMSAERGDQFLTVGRDFPIGEDPSLWCSLDLLDADRKEAGETKTNSPTQRKSRLKR